MRIYVNEEAGRAAAQEKANEWAGAFALYRNKRGGECVTMPAFRAGGVYRFPGGRECWEHVENVQPEPVVR